MQLAWWSPPPRTHLSMARPGRPALHTLPVPRHCVAVRLRVCVPGDGHTDSYSPGIRLTELSPQLKHALLKIRAGPQHCTPARTWGSESGCDTRELADQTGGKAAQPFEVPGATWVVCTAKGRTPAGLPEPPGICSTGEAAVLNLGLLLDGPSKPYSGRLVSLLSSDGHHVR